jgi:hypothetical protein
VPKARDSRWRLLLIVALWLALASCGQSPREPVESALVQAQAAFAAQDAERLCSLLSRKGRVLIGSSGHRGSPFHCADDIRDFFAWTDAYRIPAEPRVESVHEGGDDNTTATVRLPSGERLTLPFGRDDGEWRLDGLLDARLSSVQMATNERIKALLDEPGPAPERIPSNAVNVRKANATSGQPCPPTDTHRFPAIRGGCTLQLTSEGIDVSVWTPFGVIAFGTCNLDADLRIDDGGHVWITQFMISGINPCSDVVPCTDRNVVMVPWQAALERTDDGSWTLPIADACLDTCLGRSEGDWRFHLVEGKRNWQLRLASMLGTSGWRLDGTARSAAKPIAID